MNRGQSETLGVVLLLGIAVIGAMAVTAAGLAALDRDQERVGTAQAERSLSQFDSRASDVALGRSESARVDAGLPDTEGTISVRPEEGWIRIRLTSGGGDPPPGPGDSSVTAANVTLGSVVYQQGSRTVGYQSGGVFQSNGNRSVLLSRPEYHYRNGTLTIPIVKTEGGAAVASVLQVTHNGTVRKFPDSPRDLTNEVDDRTVTVTVKSRYYEAWGEFFQQQPSGNVTIDDQSETASIQFDTKVKFLHVTVNRMNVSSG